MDDIFEKLYNLYELLLEKLYIGYSLQKQDFEDIWELIQLLDFIKFGDATEDEMLWIADKYETIGATIIELDDE